MAKDTKKVNININQKKEDTSKSTSSKNDSITRSYIIDLTNEIKRLNKSIDNFSKNLADNVSKTKDSSKNKKEELILSDISRKLKDNIEQIHEFKSFIKDASAGTQEEVNKILGNVKNNKLTQNQLEKIKSLVDKDKTLQEKINKSFEEEPENRLTKIKSIVSDHIEQFKKQHYILVAIIASTYKILNEFDKITQSIIEKFGTINTQAVKLNLELQRISVSTLKYGIDIDNLVESLEAVSGTFGTINTDTAEFVAKLSKGLSITSDEAGQLAVNMKSISGLSDTAAKDSLKYAINLTEASNIAKSKAFKDMAGSADVYAKWTKEGGKNIATAAIYAAQLGSNLEEISQFGESLLLDFQGSTEKAYRAQIMLGKQIDINRARQLAWNGDLDASHRLMMEQLVAVGEWETLNYLQRKNIADTLGVNVSKAGQMIGQYEDTLKLQKEMSSTWNNINDASLDEVLHLDKMNSHFEKIRLYISAIWKAFKIGFAPLFEQVTKFLDKYQPNIESLANTLIRWAKNFGLIIGGALSIITKSLGIVTGSFLELFKKTDEAGIRLKDSGNKILLFFSDISDYIENHKWIGWLTIAAAGLFLFYKPLAGIAKLAISAAKALGAMVGIGKAAAVASKVSFSRVPILSKIRPKQMLAGASAMLVVASAIWVLSKAMQQFSTSVNWDGVKMGISSLATLTAATVAIGMVMLSGVGTAAILAGAAAFGVMAGSMWVLGKAMQEFSKAVTMTIPFFKLLGNLNGKNLIEVGKGLGIIAAGMGALSIAMLAMIGQNVIQSLGSLFGIKSPIEKIIEYSKEADNIKKMADAFSTIGEGLEKISISLKAITNADIKKLDKITNTDLNWKIPSSQRYTSPVNINATQQQKQGRWIDKDTPIHITIDGITISGNDIRRESKQTFTGRIIQ